MLTPPDGGCQGFRVTELKRYSLWIGSRHAAARPGDTRGRPSPRATNTHVTKVVGAGRVTSTAVVRGVLTAQVRTERSGVTVLRGVDGAYRLLGGDERARGRAGRRRARR